MINICDFVQVSSLKEGAQLSISGLLDVGIEDGRYEVKNGKIRRKEMQKEKKYTDAEVRAILIEELDKKGLKKKKSAFLPPYYICNDTNGILLCNTYAEVFINNTETLIKYKEPQSINLILALVDEALGVQKPEEKPKFKVGDRVRILSDAIDTANKVTVVKSHNVKSAIGCIGIIVDGRTVASKLRVAELPAECYSDYVYSWFYRNDQLELIEEEHEPITPENIEEVLKYNGVQNWQVCKYVNGVENDILLILFDNPKWLQHLELEVGKLKPLPKKKELTLEEALVELGFKKEDNACCHTKGRLAICTGKFQEIYIRKRVTETQEPITYTTKEQLAKDIAAFEEKHKFRPHWSLVDDGGHGKEIGKIYADELESLEDGYLCMGLINALTCFYLSPRQYKCMECTFGMLDINDGSLIKAFWMGEE